MAAYGLKICWEVAYQLSSKDSSYAEMLTNGGKKPIKFTLLAFVGSK